MISFLIGPPFTKKTDSEVYHIPSSFQSPPCSCWVGGLGEWGSSVLGVACPFPIFSPISHSRHPCAPDTNRISCPNAPCFLRLQALNLWFCSPRNSALLLRIPHLHRVHLISILLKNFFLTPRAWPANLPIPNLPLLAFVTVKNLVFIIWSFATLPP